MDETRQILTSAIQRLLRPLVSILLRNGISFGTFMNIAKWVYVDVADQEFSLTNKKQTDSRIAVITGLSRKEVKNVRQIIQANDIDITERHNRAARVISGWVRDPTFQNGWGEPAVLPMTGEGATFSQLVMEYSGNVPARAILDELRRVKAVEQLPDDRIRLLERAYVPHTGKSDKFNLLGTDVAHFIATIAHNLACDTPEQTRFQRKVAYDNVPAEVIPELKQLTEEQAQALLEHLDRWLAERDRDFNPQVIGTGRKYTGVGIYFFEENIPESTENED
jgi:hypothetical protein